MKAQRFAPWETRGYVMVGVASVGVAAALIWGVEGSEAPTLARTPSDGSTSAPTAERELVENDSTARRHEGRRVRATTSAGRRPSSKAPLPWGLDIASDWSRRAVPELLAWDEAVEQWASEPYDEDWSQNLLAYLDSVLFAHDADVSVVADVDCRRSYCRLELDYAEASLRSLQAEARADGVAFQHRLEYPDGSRQVVVLVRRTVRE